MNKIKKIKLGKISEDEFVEIFATEAQKQMYYNDYRSFVMKKYKQAMLDIASRYCKYKCIGKGKKAIYYISRIYITPIPKNFSKMSCGVYQYIIPLILNTLVTGYDENNKITFTIGKWARELKMINSNYDTVKRNKHLAADRLFVDVRDVDEFFSKSDGYIENYITQALEYLKATGNIIWREVYQVVYEIADDNISIDENGNIKANIRFETHTATDDEIAYYAECIKIADKEMEINNDFERWYGGKSQEWKHILSRELYKKKIKLIYKAYQAYYVHLDKCKFLLKLFGKSSAKTLSNKLAKEYIKSIIDLAGKRYRNNPEKYNKYGTEAEYEILFRNMCDIVINPKAECIERIIENNENLFDYKLEIKEHHNE